MGLFSLAKLFGMTIRESATDGSDFTNPDADYRRLFLGEDGLLHVKDSAGAVTDPYTSGAGALILLEQYTASSSASLDFTSAISSTYDDYLIEIISLLPATDGAIPYLLFGTGGGPTWDTGSNYGWQILNSGFGGGTVGVAGYTSTTEVRLFNAGQSSSYPMSMSLHLWDPGNASYRKFVGGQGVVTYNVGPAHYLVNPTGSYNSTTAITGVQILYSSGNIASGTVRMYGVVK